MTSMASSLHSDSAGLDGPSARPVSQRVVRHALAILNLLTTEGGTGTSRDTGSCLSMNLLIPGKNQIIQRIQKLVLGIIHLLTEGPPHFDEVVVRMSSEEWINVEAEQRDLYKDLMAENEQILRSLASCSVKTETASRVEKEEQHVRNQLVTQEKESFPGNVRSTYSDDLSGTTRAMKQSTNPSTFEDYHNTLSDNYPSTFLSNSTHVPQSDDCEDSINTYETITADGCMGSPQTTYNKDTFMSTYPSTLPDTGSMLSTSTGQSSITDTYQNAFSNTLTDKQPIIQIKQEGSQMELNSWHWTVEDGTDTHNSPTEQAMQILGKKPDMSPNQSIHCRNSTHVNENQNKVKVLHAPSKECLQTEYKKQSSTEQIKRYSGKSESRPPSRKPHWKKPFECLRCDKSFNCRSHLVMHQRVHTRERPYVCTECGKSFTQSSNLFRHQRGHRGERPHVCTYCGKTFTHSSYLLIHQRTHTGEKPYTCRDCGKCFRVNSTLVRHQRVHMGEKRYNCPTI